MSRRPSLLRSLVAGENENDEEVVVEGKPTMPVSGVIAVMVGLMLKSTKDPGVAFGTADSF